MQVYDIEHAVKGAREMDGMVTRVDIFVGIMFVGITSVYGKVCERR